jgi:hypothetical protein
MRAKVLRRLGQLLPLETELDACLALTPRCALLLPAASASAAAAAAAVGPGTARSRADEGERKPRREAGALPYLGMVRRALRPLALDAAAVLGYGALTVSEAPSLPVACATVLCLG